MNSTAMNEKKEVELLKDKIMRANKYIEQAKYRMALSVATTALQTAPGCTELARIQAEVTLGMGQYNECYAMLTKLMRKDPQNLQYIFLRGKALYYQGQSDQAIKHFQQILRSDPDHRQARVELNKVKKLNKAKERGNDAFKRRKWAEALEAYTECLEVDPSAKAFNAKVFCNRAATLTNLGRHEEAISDCSKAIAEDSKYAKAYLRRAKCREEIGGVEELQEALRDYEEAKRICSQSAAGSGVDGIERSIRAAQLALKKAKRKDYYKLLGVSQRATEAEIKKGYVNMPACLLLKACY